VGLFCDFLNLFSIDREQTHKESAFCDFLNLFSIDREQTPYKEPAENTLKSPAIPPKSPPNRESIRKSCQFTSCRERADFG
jgi:hypothetical protein